MKKISVSVREDHVDALEDLQERDAIDSRSSAVREIIDEWEDLRPECERLRSEYEDVRNRLESREERIDELEEQLARRSQVEEKVETLATTIDEKDEPSPPWPVRWYRWIRKE